MDGKGSGAVERTRLDNKQEGTGSYKEPSEDDEQRRAATTRARKAAEYRSYSRYLP